MQANNGETAESFRIKFLGTKGIVKNLMQEMKNVPNEKKKEIGLLLNDFKQTAEAKYELLKAASSTQKAKAKITLIIHCPAIIYQYRHKTSVKHCAQSHCFNISAAWVLCWLKDLKLKMTGTTLLL